MTLATVRKSVASRWTLSTIRSLSRWQILSLAIIALALGWALAPSLFGNTSPILGDATRTLQPHR